MEEKQRFVSLARSGHFTVSELCEEFGISRKSWHKWLGRYASAGMAGLQERSRVPKRVTSRTEEAVERIIVSEKRLHPTLGLKKIQRVLTTKHGMERAPVVSTVGEVLKRHGMLEERRRRGGVFKVERGEGTEAKRCNEVLGVDFKGWFLTGDGERCDPLTVSDLFSRYLLRAEGLPQATTRWTQRAFRSLFKSQRACPDIIRVEQRGTIRLHGARRAQQVNEALGMRTPGEVCQSSARRLDERIKVRLYDAGTQTRRVSEAGFIAWEGKTCYVGESFGGVEVALEVDDESGLVAVRYAYVRLGNFAGVPNARLRPPPHVGNALLANPRTNEYNNKCVTHVVGQSVTHVPVRTERVEVSGKGVRPIF